MAEASPTTPADGGTATTTTTTQPTSTTSSTTEQPTLLNQETKPSSETKPEEKTLLNAESKKPEGEGEKKSEDKKSEGAPEKYTDFSVPEGYELDKGVTESASAIFKKYNLSQAAAQELVDFYSKHAIESSQAALKAVKDMQDDWANQTRQAFPEAFDAQGKIKSDSKLLVGINRMLDSLQDPKMVNDFRQAMDLTGAGSHPAFARIFNRLAEMLGEGTAVRGNNPSPHGQTQSGSAQRRSAAQDIYPNLPSAMGS